MLAIAGFVGRVDFVEPGTVRHAGVADAWEGGIAPGWAVVGGGFGHSS